MKSVSRLFVVFTLALLTGFDTSNHSIPLDEIHSGGPPKDGIPALYDPEFVTADEATFLKPQDRVLGLFINGEAKAYPIWILNWHELVNDRVGGEAAGTNIYVNFSEKPLGQVIDYMEELTGFFMVVRGQDVEDIPVNLTLKSSTTEAAIENLARSLNMTLKVDRFGLVVIEPR